MRILKVVDKHYISISKIPIKGTIYDTVDYFRDKKPIINIYETKPEKVLLRDIINLHNNDGIQSLSQIKTMIKDIESGNHIFKHKLPNVKIVKTNKNEVILFDGHHSMLACIATGKKNLDEIPHIVVENEDGYVTDKEIEVFFGKHKIEDWRNFTINWQNPDEKQLCGRMQKNMGQLFDAVKDQLTGTAS